MVPNLRTYLNEAVFEDYIHLKNAYYVYESRLLPTVGEGVLWRGRLASVTGWSLGSLNTRRLRALWSLRRRYRGQVSDPPIGASAEHIAQQGRLLGVRCG